MPANPNQLLIYATPEQKAAIELLLQKMAARKDNRVFGQQKQPSVSKLIHYLVEQALLDEMKISA